MVSSPATSPELACSTHHTSQFGLRLAARGLSRLAHAPHVAPWAWPPHRTHGTTLMLASRERHLPWRRVVGGNSPEPAGTIRCGNRGEPRTRSRNGGGTEMFGESVAIHAVRENLRSGGSGTRPETMK